MELLVLLECKDLLARMVQMVNVASKGPMVFKVLLEIKVIAANEVNVVNEEQMVCKVILQMF